MPDALINFADCLYGAIHADGFLENYDRLRGTNLCRRGSPLDLMVDDATGRTERELKQFVLDVKDLVWDRLPPETKGESLMSDYFTRLFLLEAERYTVRPPAERAADA